MLKALGPAASCSLHDALTEAVVVCWPWAHSRWCMVPAGQPPAPVAAAWPGALRNGLPKLSHCGHSLLPPFLGALENDRSRMSLSASGVHGPEMRRNLKAWSPGPGWSQEIDPYKTLCSVLRLRGCLLPDAAQGPKKPASGMSLGLIWSWLELSLH